MTTGKESMLKGKELLSYVKENPDMDQAQIARGAGYVRETKNGDERVEITKLTKALLEAKGVHIKSASRPGKVARHETTVHKNGVALVGKTYIEEFGLNPGDKLEIVVGDDCISLKPKLSTSTPSATGACSVDA